MKMRLLLNAPQVVRSDCRCEYCGEDLLANPRLFESLVLDHLNPRSNGGGNSVENLRLACAACDRLKRDHVAMSVEEAREYLAAFRVGLGQWFERFRQAYREA